MVSCNKRFLKDNYSGQQRRPTQMSASEADVRNATCSHFLKGSLIRSIQILNGDVAYFCELNEKLTYLPVVLEKGGLDLSLSSLNHLDNYLGHVKKRNPDSQDLLKVVMCLVAYLGITLNLSQYVYHCDGKLLQCNYFKVPLTTLTNHSFFIKPLLY